MVEHSLRKRGVDGSSPSFGSNPQSATAPVFCKGRCAPDARPRYFGEARIPKRDMDLDTLPWIDYDPNLHGVIHSPDWRFHGHLGEVSIRAVERLPTKILFFRTCVASMISLTYILLQPMKARYQTVLISPHEHKRLCAFSASIGGRHQRQGCSRTTGAALAVMAKGR